MVGVLYVVFKPKFDVQFEQTFEKIELNRDRILTLVIFVFIALSWVFSSQLNPIISGLLGLKGNIGSFDSIMAMVAAALIVLLA
ncbi:di- and tricarboxylate transporter [Actinobacillus equuli]|nr:di- and tricarboxylate transporter [Actinobacillus equuli]